MDFIIITKKEKAAAHLIKESIYQIKDYIEDNMKAIDIKNSNDNFPLIIFMADLSLEWLMSIIKSVDLALENGKAWIEDKDVSKILKLVDFYKKSSGDLFFALNLFDVANGLLNKPDGTGSEKNISIRIID
jgi:hypothetical protein